MARLLCWVTSRGASEKREIIFASLPIFHFPSFSLKRPPRRILSRPDLIFPSSVYDMTTTSVGLFASQKPTLQKNNKTTKRIDTLEFYFFSFSKFPPNKKKENGGAQQQQHPKKKKKKLFSIKKKVVSLEKSDRN